MKSHSKGYIFRPHQPRSQFSRRGYPVSGRPGLITAPEDDAAIVGEKAEDEKADEEHGEEGEDDAPPGNVEGRARADKEDEEKKMEGEVVDHEHPHAFLRLFLKEEGRQTQMGMQPQHRGSGSAAGGASRITRGSIVRGEGRGGRR